MTSEPGLLVADTTGPVRGIAVVLHGGRADSHARVRGAQLAVLRMRPFVADLRTTDGLVVAQVRYRVRGWNGAERSPVADTGWALDRLAARFPDVPIGLVGHSMGGRTAMYVAGHESVRSVVGLAPWLEPGDPTSQLAGRRVLIAHGDADRMTSPSASAEYARQIAQVAASVGYVTVRGERHAMLRRARLWTALSTAFTRAVLLGTPPDGSAGPEIAKLVVDALSGRPSLVI